MLSGARHTEEQKNTFTWCFYVIDVCLTARRCLSLFFSLSLSVSLSLSPSRSFLMPKHDL